MQQDFTLLKVHPNPPLWTSPVRRATFGNLAPTPTSTSTSPSRHFDMSFFDFFFPEQAQASHLRSLAEQGQSQSTSLHRQRLQLVQQQRQESSRTLGLEQRIAELERDLGQAGLAIEALLELLEQSGVVTRDALAIRTQEIDARDGVRDGSMTPLPAGPFTPGRQWPGTAQP